MYQITPGVILVLEQSPDGVWYNEDNEVDSEVIYFFLEYIIYRHINLFYLNFNGLLFKVVCIYPYNVLIRKLHLSVTFEMVYF